MRSLFQFSVECGVWHWEKLKNARTTILEWKKNEPTHWLRATGCYGNQRSIDLEAIILPTFRNYFGFTFRVKLLSWLPNASVFRLFAFWFIMICEWIDWKLMNLFTRQFEIQYHHFDLFDFLCNWFVIHIAENVWTYLSN